MPGMDQLLRLYTATMAKCFLVCDQGEFHCSLLNSVLLVPFTYFKGIFLKLLSLEMSVMNVFSFFKNDF